MSRILVVDDDRFLAANLVKLLEAEDYEVRAVHSGEDALVALAEWEANLVVLDVGLPGADGIATCRRLRKKWHMPVIMLTARGESIEKVVGLEVGADDYVTKPFDGEELIARVRAQLRRCKQYAGGSGSEPLVVGPLQIDFDRRIVLRDGAPLDFSTREFEIVAYLARNLNRPISRERLFEEIWGYDSDFNSNSLDVYIYRIRQRLEPGVEKPQILQTVRGYGYKLSSPE